MNLIKRISLSRMAIGLVGIVLALMLVFGVALAPTETTAQTTIATDIPQELVSLAQDLDCQTVAQCAEKFDANFEQGITLAQKYDIYTPEEKKLAATFQTEVLERLRTVSQDNFEEEILALANKILKEKPALAKTMGVTRQGVDSAEIIINTVKDAGVDIGICQKSPEDLSREQLIACIKASNDLSSKEKVVGDYIPKENTKAKEAERMLDLENSLLAGEYSGLGKIGVEQAGQICLKPGSESIADCDQIAQRFFGNEGVKYLQEARQQTTRIKEYYTQGIEKMELVTPDGQKLIGKGAIKNACDKAFENSNLGLARACGNFAVKNGYATQAEIEDGLKLMESFSQKAEGVNFDNCRFNPESCREFLPDEFRSQFDSQFEIIKIMSESIGFDPARCENSYDPDIGKRCLEGAKKALSQVEAIAQKSPEARRIVDEIRSHINEGERMTERRDKFHEESRAGGNAGPGGCRGPEECFKYCSQPVNSAECISFGAKSQIFDQNTVVQRFNIVNESNQGFDYRSFPNLPDSSGQFGQQPRFNNQYPPQNPYPPRQPAGPSPECMAAISSGDFAKAKTACSSVTENYPRPIAEPFPVCPVYAMPSPCPAGQMRQPVSDAKGCPTYGACTVIENYKPVDTSPRPCSSGQYWNGTTCVASPIPQCSSNQWWDSNTQTCKSSQPVSNSCGSLITQATCQASPGCGWANGACGGNTTTGNTCPAGQYWYYPPAGGAGYCMSSNNTTCTSGQYWNGTACVSSPTSTSWSSKTWTFKDGTTQSSSILSRTDSEYTAYISRIESDCRAKYFAGWKPGAGDQTNWQGFGVPECSTTATTTTATSCASGQYWNGSACVANTSGNCPTGYHSHSESGGFCMNDQENYSGTCYNSAGTATMVCPQQTYAGPGCASGQYWNGSVCVSSGSGCGSYTNQANCVGSSLGCNWKTSGSNGWCEQATTAGSCGNYICESGETTSCLRDCATYTSCPSGQYWDYSANSCKSNTSYGGCTGTTQSSCTSTSNCYWNSSGNYCYYQSTSPSSTSCPSGQYWYTPPSGDSGYCMTSTTSSCPSGQYWNGSSCVSSTTSTTCSSGQYWNGTACVATSTTDCPSGQYWNGTACQSNTTTSPTTSSTTCSSDQYWDGSSCVTSPTPEPTAMILCNQSGGDWTGAACNLAKNISDQKDYYNYYQKQSIPLLGQVFAAVADLFR